MRKVGHDGNDEVMYCGFPGTAKDHGKKEIGGMTKHYGKEMELWETWCVMGMMRSCTVGFWIPQRIMERRICKN